ncbi:FtsX-like permease family protein [Neolewinella persica]|uniref:FtsX-like permease family protein n=1 Tax=Neolewinella persica TaxID=70998 RepID=UPI00035EFC05|nr:FtsX-like permease family protein [Neolewinella persica]
MDDFNLDAALADWRRYVVAEAAPETGDLEELEAGLLDRYDEFLIKGHSPADAFAEARRLATPPARPTAVNTKLGAGWSLLANYLKVGVRNLRNRRWYNLTNFVSLTMGIITAVLAVLYLNYETSYDAFVPQADRKYRVGMDLRSQGYSMISFPDFTSTESVGQRRQIEAFTSIPGVERAVQFSTFPEPQKVTINEREISLTDQLQTNTPLDFLAYFDWKLLAGSPGAFAATPLTALLTEREAIRFFGDDWQDRQPVGQTLRIDTTDYTIAGVLANVPPNAHFNFSLALNTPKINYWGARIYVELTEGADPDVVRQTINENFGTINSSLAEDVLFGGVMLQPLLSIHLNSDLLYELKPRGSLGYLYIIGLIALVILLITISNYTNLSVVMNAGRAREIGMRKVFGAADGQVAGQFVLEAVLLSLLTLPVVLLGLWWLIPRFNQLMGVEISRAFLGGSGLLAPVLGIVILVGLLSSIYPALFLARTRVQGLFKGRLIQDAGGKVTTRKVVVTLQFILLISLCSLTLFINKQLAYIQDKDLGYRKEGILYVNLNADSSRFSTFRNEMLRLPEVTAVGTGTPMGQSPYNQLTYRLNGTEEVFDDAHNIYMDYQSIAQMGIQTSIPEYIADPETAPARLVLINSTLADKLKNRFDLTDADLIGKTITQEPEYVDEETGEVGIPYLIAGTFQDVHMFSLRERVDPMFLTVYKQPRYVYWASLSYQDASPAEILDRVEERYQTLGVDQDFVHAFLDENLTELYVEETRVATLINYLSLLAIAMAVIGLIALTAYLTTLRRKEIGIRKILGASHLDILRRFNLEYLPLLGLAMMVSVPLTWWGVAWWLKGFAYRISIGPEVFLLAGLIVLLITGLAVSLVTLRAAGAIPASVLTRNE